MRALERAGRRARPDYLFMEAGRDTVIAAVTRRNVGPLFGGGME